MTAETVPKQSSETVQNIIDTATQIFAEVGFAGARVDEIARRANVNKAAIYYHIGGKEALYVEVLQHLFTDLVEQTAQNVQKAEFPEEKLRMYVRSVGNTIQNRPQMASIMLREIAAGAQHLPDIIVETLTRLIGILSGILRQGEEAGLFAPTFPLMLHFMIIGQFIFSKTTRKLVSQHNAVIPEELKTIHQKLLERDMVHEVETLVLRTVKKSCEE